MNIIHHPPEMNLKLKLKSIKEKILKPPQMKAQTPTPTTITATTILNKFQTTTKMKMKMKTMKMRINNSKMNPIRFL